MHPADLEGGRFFPPGTAFGSPSEPRPVADRLDGFGKLLGGRPLGAYRHVRFLGGEVHHGLLHTGYSSQRLFNPQGAGGAGHPLNLQCDAFPGFFRFHRHGKISCTEKQQADLFFDGLSFAPA